MLRIIAVKRRKGHGARAPASGSVTGVTQSPFQAARMRLRHTPNKEPLIAEYAAAHGLAVGHIAARRAVRRHMAAHCGVSRHAAAKCGIPRHVAPCYY